MSDLAKSNPFDQALAALEKDMPATFELAVDDHIFRNIPMHEAAKAIEISSAMENMKHKARAMGYDVTTTYDKDRQQWVYGFAKPQEAKPATA